MVEVWIETAWTSLQNIYKGVHEAPSQLNNSLTFFLSGDLYPDSLRHVLYLHIHGYATIKIYTIFWEGQTGLL